MDLGETLIHFAKPWEEVSHSQIREVYTYLHESGLRADFDSFARIFVRVHEEAAGRSDIFKVEIPTEEIIAKTLSKFNVKNLPLEFLRKATEVYFTPEVGAWQPYADAVDTLSKLADNKFKLGLVSNARSEWVVNEILDKYDLRKFFGTIITSAALRVRKPRPDIFSRALRDLDAKAKNSVFIGDSLEADISGARNVGMHSIYVSRKPQDNPSMAFPEATVFSLTEALETIMSWNSAEIAAKQERRTFTSSSELVSGRIS